jgi:mono/diheme cytochrome c family protein
MPRLTRVLSWRWSWLAVLLGLFLTRSTAPGQAPAGEDEPFLPGLRATYRDGHGRTASRVDHQLAFHWGAAAPDPRLGDSAFRATWEGHLYVQARGDYRFYLFGTGEVELKVAGQAAVARQTLRQGWSESPPLPLASEFLPLELSFRRTEKDARLMVLWSGPDFGLEPVPPRLLFHPRQRALTDGFDRGQLLSRVLRCSQCHGDKERPQPAPALDRLGGNVSRAWLVRWLVAGEHARLDQADAPSPRRMPAFGLSASQAEAIADWLLDTSAGLQPAQETVPAATLPPPAEAPKPARAGRKPVPAKPKPDARAGERLFLTLGCLACHTWRDLGASGWLDGGDLTHVADKRPPGFFAAWLADPARLNADHRMPVFPLSPDERTSLALFLAEQKPESSKPEFGAPGSAQRRAEGGRLVAQFRCASCHRLPGATGDPPALAVPQLGEQSDWSESCLGTPSPVKQRPGYRLGERDARALRQYYTSRRPAPEGPPDRLDGGLLLAEHNCLACHAREGAREAIPLLPPLLSDKLTAVAQRHPDLAPLVPALTPPPLNSVGDKLTDHALADAIAQRGEPHRPYLAVRMPRFPLRDEELQALVQHLVATDRVPEQGASQAPAADRSRLDRYALAGGRLVSSDGFGCTSCHQAGSVLPSQAPLNARGPNLSQLDRRLRRPWFDRWLRNPARIVPRMEMPSVQIPVPGVLDGKLDDQVAAVWHVLNLPGFEPPPPGPIRVFRHHGHDAAAAPLVLTDILQHGGKELVKPFLVGLANRHNVVLDLESAGLAIWTVGDAARQRTKGKTWFWELAGAPILAPAITGPDVALTVGDRELSAQSPGQFVTEADAWQAEGPGLELRYRLRFGVPGSGTETVTLQVRRKLTPLPADPADPAAGFAQELRAGPVPSGVRLRLRVLSPQAAGKAERSADGRTLRLGDRFSSRIVLWEPAGATFSEDSTGVLLTPDEQGTVRAVLHYRSEIPIDRFPEPTPLSAVGKAEPVEIAPGFTGERLPLAAEIMPTGLTWRPDGRLVFSSLKGQVFEAVDTDRDGREDRLVLLADGLPAPYGVQAGPDYVDVSAKYAVLRVWEGDRRVEAVASGWGYTPDYHDWAVGLPRNERGEYFLAIPCQQDKRAPAAARFHGNVLRLVPRSPTTNDPRRFALEPVSAGHRFPMGMALDRNGELFVTDNQGNYNPFNELNHVRPGAHFGFINTLDRGKPVPALTPPAIDIPHPWTRSVNGICFLSTPRELREQLGRDVFGPLEGHLIGCEYDTRRLVRLTLQRVGDIYQGAAYPLSISPPDPARGFLGPVVCAVSPRGELYVGSIRDSGWGAGNNLGEIVRVRVEPTQLPCGIAEVRATRDGFVLDFCQPVDREPAGRADSYTIQSYRRESTPAYGGPDLDRRTEKVAAVDVTADARRVTLRLAELRPGFVYEFRLKNLAPGGSDFHPAEAHYTLRVVPR